jgi:hypothetical protein
MLDGGLLLAMRPGSVLVNHGTGLPAFAVEMTQLAARHGIDVLDAPVSGGPAGAVARQGHVVGQFVIDGRVKGMVRRGPHGQAGLQSGIRIAGLFGQIPSGIETNQQPNRRHGHAGAWPHGLAVAG